MDIKTFDEIVRIKCELIVKDLVNMQEIISHRLHLPMPLFPEKISPEMEPMKQEHSGYQNSTWEVPPIPKSIKKIIRNTQRRKLAAQRRKR